jgi:hypothetical protein
MILIQLEIKHGGRPIKKWTKEELLRWVKELSQKMANAKMPQDSALGELTSGVIGPEVGSLKECSSERILLEFYEKLGEYCIDF